MCMPQPIRRPAPWNGSCSFPANGRGIGGGLGSLQNIGGGKLAGGSARTFVDNWDTERNGSTLSYRDGAAYALATIFMLAHPYGSPNVYSGYEFSAGDAGPPSGGSGWTGNHARPEITAWSASATPSATPGCGTGGRRGPHSPSAGATGASWRSTTATLS
ncbi:hypothetical protein GCM10009863_33590 [Streptomyces axinellae]|uniref:Glycosyl hydrolase family 13 catalytic domain-containing protein n=1 Tax=Streptomyces axinellae TaxID=552788 RepID=A0ABN3Q8G2_9ACTN